MATLRRIAFIILVLSIGGCATAPTPGSTVDEKFYVGIDALLAEHVGPVPTNWTPRQYREMRLLRAQLTLAIIARYGAARMEDFSADRRADAARMLGLIEIAEGALLKGRKAVQQDEIFFNVYRTDIVFAAVDMSAAALEPTVRGIRLLVVSTSPLERIRHGRELLRNVLEDKLYSAGYQQDYKGLLERVEANGNRVTDSHWRDVSQQLTEACDRLIRMVGKPPQDCVPSDMRKAIP